MNHEDLARAQEAAASEASSQLRQFWKDSIAHAAAHGHSEEAVVIQMLAVATHAAERVLGRDVAVRLYTDQAALLMELDAEDRKIVAASAGKPRH